MRTRQVVLPGRSSYSGIVRRKGHGEPSLPMLCLVVAALALAAGASAAPRPTSDATSPGRETGAVRSEAGRLVTGSPEHLQSVVPGTPVTTAGGSGGSIVAWGYNLFGQTNVPAPNSGFVGLAAGGGHNLGLKTDGSIVAWGLNDYGQTNVPAPNTGFVAVAGGVWHSLGLKSDGSIVGWGDNTRGQIDVPSPNTGFTAVASQLIHSLGLKADGSIVAWGYNGDGQTNVPSPNISFVAMAAGNRHSLALKSDGSIVAWGCENPFYNYGQCNVPTPNADFVAVAAGDYHSLGVKTDGSIVPWGDNGFGQANVPAPNSGFVAVGTGVYHSFGLKADGSIVGWGDNLYGQTTVPAPNTGFVAVFAGPHHNVGLKDSNFQACCFSPGHCSNLDQTYCANVGGTPGGAGTTCPNTCPCTGLADCPDDGLFCNGTGFCNLTSGLCAQSGNPCTPNQVCDEEMDACLDFGACCLDMGTVCFETNEPDCVDLPPNGAGGVFLGHKSTCPEQNAQIFPEGNGTVFVHVIGPPVDCPPHMLVRAAAGCPPSGPYTDPWVSNQSAAMCHNFGSLDTNPIPAGFFDPGSDLFTSTVCLRGVPLGLPQYGDADTLISRSADPFDRCDLPSGTPSTVDIEIVTLSLEGTAPITVSYTAGPDEQWDVKVDLSPGGLLPGTPSSTLTGVKTHCNSGTYTSVLYVQPRFTFTKVGDPLQVRVLDTLMAGTAPVELRQDDPHPWVSDMDPFLGAMVDLCSDFHANISDNNPSLECDCNNNSLLDACEGLADCQPNSVPDPCDITAGTSVDLNNNTRPDECDPLRPVGSGSPDKNRYGGLSVPAAATAAAAPTALRIKLVELQNPVPLNAPCCPAQDFSAYEYGPSCTDPDGCVRWVGPTSTYLESQDTPGIGSFRAARLQCTPLYRDWSSEGFFHITAAEIAPSSTIDVENVGASCMTIEDTCLDYSPALRIDSARWGDVADAFNPPSPTTQPDGLDVSAMVSKFKNLVGAPSKIQTQLQPNLVELNADLSALDISLCVDAFKGMAYPYPGPCPCPSTVTCNNTPCATPAACPGGSCVKTCNGGLNDTLPCVNNTHCPGSMCGDGFCRDACGRCTP